MDGSGSAVASSKCSIREIREIRGPIPSLAAGRAVPSAPLRENILAKMDDSQTLQAKTVGREGGGFGAPGCTRHYQQDPAQSRLQAGAPTSLSGARTGSFFSAPSAPLREKILANMHDSLTLQWYCPIRQAGAPGWGAHGCQKTA
jgi:hypothetical protein